MNRKPRTSAKSKAATARGSSAPPKTGPASPQGPTPGAPPRIGYAFLLALLLILGGMFVAMIRMFLLPILLAAVFAGLFYGGYRWLRDHLGGHANLAAFLSCLILLLVLLGPVYLVGNLIANEAISLYQGSEQSVRAFLQQASDNPIAKLQETSLGHVLMPLQIDWQKSLTDIAKASGSLVAQAINRTGRTTFQFVVNLFIVLFTMFYFFRDGERLLARIRYLSPLSDAHEEMLFARFISVSRATVRGSLLLGTIQGTLGGLLLWAFGVPSAALWGVLMVVFSIIPMVGAWLVLYPAALYKLLIGHPWQGIVIALITAVVISNIDNLLRPRLVGRDAGMHDLMIFFSTVGGIALFGVTGFIVGPVLAALLLTVLEIYGREFSTQLQSPAQDSPVGDSETGSRALDNSPSGD